jgi:hypothetical protein
MTRRIRAILLLAVTIPTGIAWRMLPLHLPYFAWKYGGSALWTVALYCLIAAIAPRLQPLKLALVSALFALLVELSRLVQQPTLEAFRRTLGGKLLLGSHFALKDIAAYWITIAILFFLDQHMQKTSR